MELILKTNLERLISQKKTSLAKLSQLTGVSSSTLSRILSGQIKRPNQATIDSISKYFKISPNLLFQKDMDEDEYLPETNENHLNIKDRLLSLMKKHSIMSIEELSGLSGVHYSTMRSILLGETENPHIETCSRIADFFGITVKQLKCEEPLDNGNINFELTNIPIIDFKNMRSWFLTKSNKFVSFFKQMSIDDKNGVFAIQIEDESFCIEYDIGDLLVFKEINEIKISGKYLCKIGKMFNIFKISIENDMVFFRLLGTSNKNLIDKKEIETFAKLIEIRVT